MHWHWTEALSIFHHLPHAHGDLLHHEDKALVKTGASGLILKPAAVPADSGSAIGKDIDPAVWRSQQNMGLLVRDYLHGLPESIAKNAEGEALMEHWRKILLEQPQRLAEAHMDSWNNERSRQFWKERLAHLHAGYGIAPEHFPAAIDDWERAAGTAVPPPQTLGVMKTKQWQDLVIRQRLHHLEMDQTGIPRTGLL